MVKASILLFVALLISLNVLSVVELVALNRATILVVSDIINLGTWILLPDKDKQKDRKKIGSTI